MTLEESMEIREQDVALICKQMSTLINRELSSAKRAISAKQYQNLGVSLRDAGDWGMIVADVATGHVKCVASLRDRISRLDTEARQPWLKLLDRIQDR
jgi:hypothetical protein